MESCGNLIEIAEMVARSREWEPRETDDRWRNPLAETTRDRVLVPDAEIEDDDGPETWAGLFA